MLFLLSSALAGPGWALILPFGVGTFTEGAPVRGSIYASTQAVGLGAAVTGTVLGDRAILADDMAASERWRFVTLGGASLGLASLFVSILDASRLHQLHGKEQAEEARIWLSYPQGSDRLFGSPPSFGILVTPNTFSFGLDMNAYPMDKLGTSEG